MEAQAKQFTIIFFSVLVVFLAGLVGLNTYVDPFKNLNAPWRGDVVTEYNDIFVKFKLLERFKDLDCLIVGSSRSEHFVPKIVNPHLKSNCFSSSIGGASAVVKLLYIRKALESPRLKTIIFVSDFYEFNNLPVDAKLYFQTEMSQYVGDYVSQLRTPDFKDRVLSYIERKVTERSMRSLFKPLKESSFKENGTIRSLNYKSPSKERLSAAIGKSLEEYRSGAWSGYTALSAPIKNIIYEVGGLSQSRSIRVIFIMTPYHPQFYAQFVKNKNLYKLYGKWKSVMLGLNTFKGVEVYDFTDSEKYFPSNGDYWTDGVHFQIKSVQELLKHIPCAPTCNYE